MEGDGFLLAERFRSVASIAAVDEVFNPGAHFWPPKIPLDEVQGFPEAEMAPKGRVVTGAKNG